MRVLGAGILLLLLGLVIATAVSLVWSRHESRVLFVQLNQLQAQRDGLNVEFGRLELQQATDAEPRVIDDIARHRLGMVEPRAQDIQLVHP